MELINLSSLIIIVLGSVDNRMLEGNVLFNLYTSSLYACIMLSLIEYSLEVSKVLNKIHYYNCLLSCT